MPRVAALMPAYNPGEAINEAVESLVNSTYPCDIYIVDDGSDVPVAEILDDFPANRDHSTGPEYGRGQSAQRRPEGRFYGALTISWPVSMPTTFPIPIVSPNRSSSSIAIPTSPRSAPGPGIRRRGRRQVSVHRAHAGEPAVGAESAQLQFGDRSTRPSWSAADVLKEVGLYSEHYPVAEDYELFRRISPTACDRQHSGRVGRSASVVDGVSLYPPAPPVVRPRLIFSSAISTRWSRERGLAWSPQDAAAVCYSCRSSLKIKGYRGRS